MNKIPCTVGVLTYNNAETLARALTSVQDFDDIIVVDGNSTDGTQDIAAQFGARVIPQDAQFKNTEGRIIDFAGIRNQHLATARHQWFLFVDSDEFLSPESVAEIRSIVEKPIGANDPLAYLLPRKTMINGTVIDCATAYPNYQMRFFNRTGVSGFIKPVHERIALLPTTKTAKLVHPEYVPLDMTPAEFYEKQRRYLAIEVERRKDDTFLMWIQGTVYRSARSSLSYLVRHVRILLFCKGKKMPLWVEWMHHWYNWKLVTMTGAKFFTPRKR
jgi:glycosyltransferase involved in cell wall biosynthesis